MNPQNSPNQPAASGTARSAPRASPTGGAISEAKHTITQTARETAAKVKSAAATTAIKAKHEAGRFVSEKKEEAASRVEGYGSALHESARSFDRQDPNIAWMTDRAADKLQSVADYMRTSDLARLRGDCEGFAHRHPAVFFGGLFFAGLMLGNAIKASRRKIDDPDANRFAPDGNPDFDDASGPREDSNPQSQWPEAERHSAGL